MSRWPGDEVRLVNRLGELLLHSMRVTCSFGSGWRDLNPRPLRPELPAGRPMRLRTLPEPLAKVAEVGRSSAPLLYFVAVHRRAQSSAASTSIGRDCMPIRVCP
jgi:hypothetical protein